MASRRRNNILNSTMLPRCRPRIHAVVAAPHTRVVRDTAPRAVRAAARRTLEARVARPSVRAAGGMVKITTQVRSPVVGVRACRVCSVDERELYAVSSA